MTSPKEIEDEPQAPTTLSAAPGSRIRLGEPFWIDLDQRSDTGELITGWILDLRVRDENLSDELEARWRVRTVGRPAPMYRAKTLPVTGLASRELEVQIERGDLMQGLCHRLELVVARSDTFLRPIDDPEDPALFDRVEDEEPARVSWVIFEGPGNAEVTAEAKQLLIDSCNAEEDFLEGTTEGTAAGTAGVGR